jgi:glycosyltransferase involved in cell wall biosynthesis
METKIPTVSVVIPTRNRPDLVCHAVRSVLAQTYSDFEIVVVVDGPDQATVEALHRLGDARIRVVALPDNVGGAEARNVGARNARGAWIALLDDDDEWLPRKLELQMQAAEQSPTDKVLVVSRFFFRSAGKPDVKSPKILPHDRSRISEYPFASHSGFQTSVFVCPRALFLRVPFVKGLPGMQDIDWFLRVMADPDMQILVVPEPLSIYNSPAGRQTITTGLTWEKPLAWAQSNRHLMTSRAYSLFIVRSCVEKAAAQRSGLRGFWTLFRECMFRGSPDPHIIFLFFTRYAFTEDRRHQIRDFFRRTASRKMDQPAYPARPGS